jgi:hypothetical protein
VVHHLLEPGLGHALHLPGVRGVHGVEEGGKGVAEVEAAAAAVADVEDPLQLLREGLPVIEGG